MSIELPDLGTEANAQWEIYLWRLMWVKYTDLGEIIDKYNDLEEKLNKANARIAELEKP